MYLFLYLPLVPIVTTKESAAAAAQNLAGLQVQSDVGDSTLSCEVVDDEAQEGIHRQGNRIDI